jgi:hypothetical protein
MPTLSTGPGRGCVEIAPVAGRTVRASGCPGSGHDAGQREGVFGAGRDTWSAMRLIRTVAARERELRPGLPFPGPWPRGLPAIVASDRDVCPNQPGGDPRRCGDRPESGAAVARTGPGTTRAGGDPRRCGERPCERLPRRRGTGSAERLQPTMYVGSPVPNVPGGAWRHRPLAVGSAALIR